MKLSNLSNERMSKAAQTMARIANLAEELDVEALTEMVALWESAFGQMAMPYIAELTGMSAEDARKFTEGAKLTIFFAIEFRKIEVPK